MKKAFTLIELLAVIIILAVIALIATPVVLKVVDNAKESARKSSVAGYADTVKLASIEKQFETGNNPKINNDFLNGLETRGEKVACGRVINNTKYGVVLHECNVGSDTNKYCFALGQIYNCRDEAYTKIYNGVKELYVDNSDASYPELDSGMIPVVISNEGIATKADLYGKWYDYDNKEWANAILVTEATRETYKDADEGTPINEEDILAYLVWVPRYKYKLFNVKTLSISPQEIEIVFERKTTPKSTGLKAEIYTNGEYLTHPAFTFGTSELDGIWVGKFETTGSETSPTIKPTKWSLQGQVVGKQFATAQKFNSAIYGLGGDAHMMKNTEWGAVVYLSHSKYGINTEIRINNKGGGITGCGASVENGSQSSICEIEYGVASEYPQSTTGNITGIFDMSGGSPEIVMGNMMDSNGDFYPYAAEFAFIPDAKYYDLYAYGTTYYDQSAYQRRILGDATGEVVGWYSDSPIFAYGIYPWFVRGGNNYNGSNSSGGFNFSNNPGAGYYNHTFRVVQVKP